MLRCMGRACPGVTQRSEPTRRSRHDRRRFFSARPHAAAAHERAKPAFANLSVSSGAFPSTAPFLRLLARGTGFAVGSLVAEIHDEHSMRRQRHPSHQRALQTLRPRPLRLAPLRQREARRRAPCPGISDRSRGGQRGLPYRSIPARNQGYLRDLHDSQKSIALDDIADQVAQFPTRCCVGDLSDHLRIVAAVDR